MTLFRIFAAGALLAAGTIWAQADGPGPDVIVKRAYPRRHVVVRTVRVHRGERDGAVVFSGKVMTREYAYPRYSPGLLPTTAAAAYGYAYAPDYGFAYRLVPPVPVGATCAEQTNLVYNTQGVFVGSGSGYSCY
ncbi:MAG: hypothetical protein JOZ16_19105 [Methylobacteriaceae bacterium]|nr:hypothetical protein [Methylobacteriaceae bacterium]